MFDIVNSIIGWNHWDALLSLLVIIHLVSEYWHYAWEYWSGRKKANILKDIQRHRKKSTKTKKLKQIQDDLNLIKKKLLIEED